MLEASDYPQKNTSLSTGRIYIHLLFALLGLLFGTYVMAEEIPVFDYGPYSVGSSNVRIAKAFSQLSGEEMDRYLIGENLNNELHFIDEILSEKDSPLLLEVSIPDDSTIYGSAAGLSLPVFIYVTYPTRADNSREHYDFPYARTADTRFEHMQSVGEKPIFADEKKRYPLVFNSHGMNSHGFWGASGSTKLSSHGYIAATLNFGDARLKEDREIYFHENLRPFIAQVALDFLLDHQDYKEHIDLTRIAASGHSLGGYTSFSLAGGDYNGEAGVIEEVRIHAVIASAPWTGANWDGEEHYPFGDKNIGLSKVRVPVLGLYGSNDMSVQPSFVLPAFQQLSGPRYVVELVDQPHIYAPGSWQDQSNWVLLFLAAYLKDDETARKQLALTTSMQDGGVDRQKFELQRLDIKK